MDQAWGLSNAFSGRVYHAIREGCRLLFKVTLALCRGLGLRELDRQEYYDGTVKPRRQDVSCEELVLVGKGPSTWQ